MMIELILPTPPSTNQLYSGRRFKTARYKAWITEAGWVAKTQWQGTISGKFVLTIYLPRGMGDVAETFTVVTDLLDKERLGIILDMREMESLYVFRHFGSELKVKVSSI